MGILTSDTGELESKDSYWGPRGRLLRLKDTPPRRHSHPKSAGTQHSFKIQEAKTEGNEKE